MTFLCISTYFKGAAFLQACKAAGNTVYLITSKDLESENWPRESLDDIFYVASDDNSLQSHQNMADGVAWLMRERRIDRIVALDDFDVEKAAYLREEFRSPGMGQTTARHFRDKLAMRVQARDAGLRVPPFTALFNNEDINAFADDTPTPWVVKPRGEASATGIKKVHSKEALWRVIGELGNQRHRYLVEQFKPGDVYHVDALSNAGNVLFCQVSKYLATPMEVAHGGGVFRTATVPYGGKEDKALQQFVRQVMDAFGMQSSASHTEFIRCHEDGEFYFLETSSRVGGAHIAEMVEAASGINLWAEWARLESAITRQEKYQLPKRRKEHAGLVVSLSRFAEPDMRGFNDEEVVWKIDKRHHVGVIVQSKKRERIIELLDDYVRRIQRDFHASAPAPDSH